MRHHNHNRKFGRVRNQRTALLKSLARALVLHERIKTTEAKAKELRPFVEKLITKGKTDSIASRRIVASRIGDGVAVKKIFDTLGSRYKERSGGYTRVLKLTPRVRDAAKMAMIEFV